MTNTEDAYDRLADALGLNTTPAHPGVHYPVPVETDAPRVDEAADTEPTAEWSADRNRLILGAPTTFEGGTEEFAARTQSFAHRPGVAARAVLAARSLASVDRISDADQRYEAFARHMAEFPPLVARF